MTTILGDFSAEPSEKAADLEETPITSQTPASEPATSVAPTTAAKKPSTKTLACQNSVPGDIKNMDESSCEGTTTERGSSQMCINRQCRSLRPGKKESFRRSDYEEFYNERFRKTVLDEKENVKTTSQFQYFSANLNNFISEKKLPLSGSSYEQFLNKTESFAICGRHYKKLPFMFALELSTESIERQIEISLDEIITSAFNAGKGSIGSALNTEIQELKQLVDRLPDAENVSILEAYENMFVQISEAIAETESEAPRKFLEDLKNSLQQHLRGEPPSKLGQRLKKLNSRRKRLRVNPVQGAAISEQSKAQLKQPFQGE